MSLAADFGDTADVAVVTLVDNLVDLCLPGTDTVRRYSMAHGDPLIGEHGLALLVHLRESGVRILWDAGFSRIALPENMRRMGIEPGSINCIALSHGHGDHFVALTDVLRAVVGPPPARIWPSDVTPAQVEEWMEKRRVPLIVHPDAFCERWSTLRDGTKYGPWTAPRAEWEAAGAQIILSQSPYRLAPGCWLTGEVPRRSFERIGTPASEVCPAGDGWVHDLVRDDQALVINVRDKGLVVLAGCAHAGIVNTVNCAREISGVSQVWAIVGGFHLVGASDDDIRRTIEEVRTFRPRIVVPTHCTGFAAQMQFATRMPEQFVVGSVGTTYLF
jgi:7,8-dihydropterin-6-yl-methyl-4-(beta-D-ribofuranosyl)aminobenzene 5'-phosphate synthase